MKWKDSEVSLKFIASQCWFNGQQLEEGGA